jgi:hypothetical protein
VLVPHGATSFFGRESNRIGREPRSALSIPSLPSTSVSLSRCGQRSHPRSSLVARSRTRHVPPPGPQFEATTAKFLFRMGKS